MIYKSFNLNFSRILEKNCTLLYGENIYLISEIEKKILEEAKNNFKLSPKRYQEDYLIQNNNLLDELLQSENLFGNKEIIIISKATDKIIDHIGEELIQKSQKKIIFISDVLTKKSKLRLLAETSDYFACVACYNDTNEQLQNILEYKLKENKVQISRKLLDSILENFTLNRQDINDAIEKIQLLQKTSSINETIIKNIFYSSSDNDNFEIANYCLSGEIKNINKILNNIYIQEVNFNEMLAALKYKVNKLINIIESNNKDLSIEKLVENFKPPIFWKEKSIIKDQLKRWNIRELYKLQDIIFETEINCKKNYEISSTILQHFIITTSTKSCLENKFI